MKIPKFLLTHFRKKLIFSEKNLSAESVQDVFLEKSGQTDQTHINWASHKISMNRIEIYWEKKSWRK